MFFSIIIPTYNRAKTVGRAIESVLSQDFSDLELIVVDDGSTDNSKDIIEQYTQKDSRLKYIYQENSGHPGFARNTGIAQATGEWLCFLDSDDFWFQGKLQATKNIIDHSDGKTVLVGHWETIYHNGIPGKVTKFRILPKGKQYLDLLFNGNALSPSAVAIRSDIVRDVHGFTTNREYFGIEDYDMWLKVAQKGHIELIEKSFGGYDITDDNISSNIEKMNNNLLNVIRDHINALPDNEFDKEKLLKRHTARVDYYRGRAYHLTKNYQKSKEYLLRSIKSYPWNPKTWMTLGLTLFKVPK